MKDSTAVGSSSSKIDEIGKRKVLTSTSDDIEKSEPASADRFVCDFHILSKRVLHLTLG